MVKCWHCGNEPASYVGMNDDCVMCGKPYDGERFKALNSLLGLLPGSSSSMLDQIEGMVNAERSRIKIYENGSGIVLPTMMVKYSSSGKITFIYPDRLLFTLPNHSNSTRQVQIVKFDPKDFLDLAIKAHDNPTELIQLSYELNLRFNKDHGSYTFISDVWTLASVRVSEFWKFYKEIEAHPA